MFEPIPINLPAYPFQLKQQGSTWYIFDELRKKHLVLTPEEWVRQHWIQHLIKEKNYPKSLISIEGGLQVNTMNRRSDLIVYDHSGAKMLLAEFKSPRVTITQKVFEQIAQYNTVHKIPLLLVSNGIQHFYCEINFQKSSFNFLPDLPPYLRPPSA